MFELWLDSPTSVFRLAKYLLGPANVVLFLALVPFLRMMPSKCLRPGIGIISWLLIAFAWGPTFAVALAALLLLGWLPLRSGRPRSALVCFVALQALYVGAFHIPASAFPVFADPRFPRVWPGLMLDRSIVFFSGLAFTNLRFIHLLVESRTQGLRPTFGGYLLYMLYAPTFGFGPWIAYDRFAAELESAGTRRSWGDVGRGLLQVVIGAAMFEAVIKCFDGWFFKQWAHDDGAYMHFWFFERPPTTRWAIAIGVILMPIRLWFLVGGYSRIASGVSSLVGIRLPPNMNAPFLADNLNEFWRRWHITATDHAKRHVFLPVSTALGRVGPGLWATFLFMGFFHHPSLFPIMWGACHAAAIRASEAWRRSKFRRKLVKRNAGSWTAIVGRGAAILLTQAFVTLSIPMLFDTEQGGLILLATFIEPP